MAFDDLEQKQRTLWGAGPFERYPSDDGGIRRPRLSLIALGTRR